MSGIGPWHHLLHRNSNHTIRCGSVRPDCVASWPAPGVQRERLAIETADRSTTGVSRVHSRLRPRKAFARGDILAQHHAKQASGLHRGSGGVQMLHRRMAMGEDTDRHRRRNRHPRQAGHRIHSRLMQAGVNAFPPALQKHFGRGFDTDKACRALPDERRPHQPGAAADVEHSRLGRRTHFGKSRRSGLDQIMIVPANRCLVIGAQALYLVTMSPASSAAYTQATGSVIRRAWKNDQPRSPRSIASLIFA